MLHESIHRCIIFFSKTPVELFKKTDLLQKILGFKNKKSTTTPPQQLLQVGVGGFFRSHRGGNAAGGGLMEAELES